MQIPFKDNPLLSWIDDFLIDHQEADVYVVGGAVRDVLRGKDAKDIDLVISGCPEDTLEAWLSAHGQVDYVGKRFGVWKFSPFHDPTNPTIDIALPRKEVSIGNTGGYRQFLIESDSTLQIEEDLKRRDFTVNAIAYSWREDKLIDPYNGRSDLREKIIRTVLDPTTRFTEDSTRILRALRFTCVLGATIETKTWEALLALKKRLNLQNGDEWIVAREMIGQEFTKAFIANPVRCIDLYAHSGIWNELFFPLEAPDLSTLIQPTTTTDFISKFGKPTTTLLITLLCSTLFKEPRDAEKWMLNWHIDADRHLVRTILTLLQQNPNNTSSAEIEDRYIPAADEILPLLYTLIKANSYKDAEHWVSRLLSVKRSIISPPLISGEDLKEWGIPEGPMYSELISKIRSAQLDKKISNKKEALELLETLSQR
ncbi:MAG: hypothetical protein O2877_01320 [bacterium]|nr:hypothetical protein [bacterium]